MSQNISVVIPTHNRAELLATTLDCVLGQTLPPTEVIVVDDESTDATASVLAQYAARGIRALRITNSSHLRARNVGLCAAKGDLVAFCDSDDLWHSTFLETAAGLWQSAPGLQVAYSNFTLVRDGQWDRETKFASAPTGFWNELRPLGPSFGVFEHDFAHRLLDFQPFFPSCMVVDREAFFRLGGWDEGVSRIVGCDFATALQMAERPPVGVMLEPLVGIRKHVSNLSANTEAMNLGNARVLEHVLQTRPSLRRWEGEIRLSIGERRRDALAAAFVRQDFAAVREIYDILPAGFRPHTSRLKAAIALLPDAVSQPVSAVALRLGSAKAALVGAAITPGQVLGAVLGAVQGRARVAPQPSARPARPMRRPIRPGSVSAVFTR